jgi:cellulose synthase/poly-beta-1,6-N-acetylglucosamine synthase-like glycosyltransferase
MLFLVIGGSVFVGVHFAFIILTGPSVNWNESVTNVIVQAVGIAVSYKLNSALTWRGVSVPGQTGRFVTVRLAALLLSVAIFNVLFYTDLMGWAPWAYQAVGVIVAMGFNFAGAEWWAFSDRGRLLHPVELEKLRIGWRTGLLFTGALALIVLVLRLGAEQMFLPVLLTLLSAVAMSTAVLFLLSIIYPHRNHMTAESLKLRAPEGEPTVLIGTLMPALNEAAVFARTILNTAWTQRDHAVLRDDGPEYLHRFFPVLCDNDPDTVRVAMAAARVANLWSAGVLQASSLADLQAAMQQPQLAEAGALPSPLTEAELAEVAVWQRVGALVQPVIYKTGGKRSSKAKQMNEALRQLRLLDKFPVQLVLDAEDDVQPGLFMYMDQAFRDYPEVDIIQGPVQLMPPVLTGNTGRRIRQGVKQWFAYLNLLEYYRWFSGQMRFQSDNGFVPWGGNTICVKSTLLEQTGGFIDSLTEDCATGVLATAVHGARTLTFYDPKLATREQVPPSTMELVKQRRRWTQGFLETFLDGHWKVLPTFTQRLLAFWILTSPFFQALSAALLPLAIVTAFFLKSPPVLVLMMFLPIMAMVVATCLQVLQLHEFGRSYDLSIPLYAYVGVVLLQILYQSLLSLAALWAVIRHLKGDTSWHRTARPEEIAQARSRRRNLFAARRGPLPEEG